MKACRLLILLGLSLCLVLPSATFAAEQTGSVTAVDGGVKFNAATWECTPGHKIAKHEITLDSGQVRYAFVSSGCTDPSHGGKHPCSEGNFGMPIPSTDNWYWGGFLKVLINGTDATVYTVKDMRVTETGARGAFQIIWDHPDAEVGLRLLMMPGGNHVLADLVWKPKAGSVLKTVAVHLTCYPSYFTAPHHRAGARHCQTPRTDLAEPQTLKLVPEQDTYLYYYDTTFDLAKGEGNGPCAALVAPAGVAGGHVSIGDYAVNTELDLKPDAGETRLAFYDFTGRTNAEAEAYMKQSAAEDLAQLIATDFRPEPVRELQLARLQSEAAKLLTDAAEDGKQLKPQVDKLLAQVAELKGKADTGDWTAEAELSTVIADSADLFWKLRALAALNNP